MKNAKVDSLIVSCSTNFLDLAPMHVLVKYVTSESFFTCLGLLGMDIEGSNILTLSSATALENIEFTSTLVTFSCSNFRLSDQSLWILF